MKILKRIFCIVLLVGSLVLASCSEEKIELTVIAPSGAPAMALGDLAVNHTEEYTVELNKSASALRAAFGSAEADVIVAPINLGAQMYIQNQAYQLASVLTWGNLYFASQKADFKLADLNGANVTLFGQGTINDIIVQHILSNKNITLGEESTYLADTNLTNAELLQNENAIVLVAEPALSAAKSKKANITSISIQDLYKEVSGANSYPQAGCFVKVETASNHKKAIRTFLTDLKASADLCNKDSSKAAEYAVELEIGANAGIVALAIPNCNIQYVKASDAKQDIQTMVGIKAQLFGGSNPVDEFYYE